MLLYNRHNDTRPEARLHVAHLLEGHETRAEGAEMAVESRIPVSVERKESAGQEL